MSVRRRKATAARAGQYRGQDGFTLIELIVVMALLMLLTAAGAWGLTGYSQYAEFKRQNEYARSIYLAAQTELTKRSQSGQLSELTALFAEDQPMDVGQLIGTDGSCVDEKQVWEYQKGGIYVLEARGSRREAQAEAPEEKSGNMPLEAPEERLENVLTEAPEGDYARYLSESLDRDDREDRKIQALYQLIDPYILDKTILMEGTIRIELEPSEGLVYAVLYSSHWPDGFGDDGIGAGERANITDRSTEYRRKAMIGYYGVDTLSKSVSGKAEKPSIRSLKLLNEEMVYVRWQVDAENLDTWKELTYDITIYGSVVWKDTGDKADDKVGEKAGDRTGDQEDDEADDWAGDQEDDEADDWAGDQEDDEADDRADNEAEWEDGEAEEVCTISLNWNQSIGNGKKAGTGIGSSGIPKKLTTLNSSTDYQVIQALVTYNGQEEWRCFPIILDELQYQITLVLDASGLLGEEIKLDKISIDRSASINSASNSNAGYRDAGNSNVRRREGSYHNAEQNNAASRSNSKRHFGWDSFADDSRGLHWFAYRDYALMDMLDENQAERIFCTVIGYGNGYVSTSMKESNEVICEFTDLEEEEQEEDAPEEREAEALGQKEKRSKALGQKEQEAEALSQKEKRSEALGQKEQETEALGQKEQRSEALSQKEQRSEALVREEQEPGDLEQAKQEQGDRESGALVQEEQKQGDRESESPVREEQGPGNLEQAKQEKDDQELEALVREDQGQGDRELEALDREDQKQEDSGQKNRMQGEHRQEDPEQNDQDRKDG